MSIKKESDLAKQFVDFFSGGYEIFKEVPAGGIIDIVAYLDPIIVAIECKMSLSIDVIEQAVKNKMYAHYSYVGVRKTKRIGFAEKICMNYGVGILTYDEEGVQRNNWLYSRLNLNDSDILALKIREAVPAKLNRKIYKPRLEQWMKQSVAGSQSDRMTAFKNTVAEIERELKYNGGRMKIKEVMAKIKHHYSSITSAKSSLIGMCNKGVIKTFDYDNGDFVLVLNSEQNVQECDATDSDQVNAVGQ